MAGRFGQAPRMGDRLADGGPPKLHVTLSGRTYPSMEKVLKKQRVLNILGQLAQVIKLEQSH